MSRDQRLGLALGVLVTGVVGALFFRESPDDPLEGPATEFAEQIDRELEHRELGPYLSGIEMEAFLESGGEKEDSVSGDAPAWDSASVPKGIGDAAASARLPVPDPIAANDGPDARRPANRSPSGGTAANLFTAESGWTVVDQPTSPNATTPTKKPTPAEHASSRFAIHVVQPGETLTGLAARYLGSARRYPEIFEANRELLEGPQDLKIGTRLRIPLDGPSRRSDSRHHPASFHGNDEPTPTTQPARSSTDKTTRSPAPLDSFGPRRPEKAEERVGSGKRDSGGNRPRHRFVPVHRNPLVPPWQRRSYDSASPHTPPIKREPEQATEATNSADERDQLRTGDRRDLSDERRSALRGTRYRVKPGDTLEGIAVRVYGDRRAARRIFEANREQLSHPDNLRAGTVLILP